MSTTNQRPRDDGHLEYLLTAYLFDNLSDAGRKEVETHLAACAQCRAELTELRSTLGMVKEALSPTNGEDGANPTPSSFERRRLERVIQSARNERTIFGWVRRHGVLVALTAAAAMLLILPMILSTLNISRNARQVRESLSEREFGRASEPGVGSEVVTAAGSRPESTLYARVATEDPLPEATDQFARQLSLEASLGADRLDDMDRVDESFRRTNNTMPNPVPAKPASAAPSPPSALSDSSARGFPKNDTAIATPLVPPVGAPRQDSLLPADKAALKEEADKANESRMEFHGEFASEENRRAGGVGGRVLTGKATRVAQDANAEDTRPNSEVAGLSSTRDFKKEKQDLEKDSSQDIQDVPGSFPASDGAALAPAVKAQIESRLRAYNFYRSLDPSLRPEVFFSQLLKVPAPAVGDEGLGEAGFRARYSVNPFVDTSRDHFSTFGMDVDTASFSLARARIQSGKLPDPKTVRVEEFVNYFREDVEADLRTVFTVRSEGGPSPFGDGLDLLKITVKARELLSGERKNVILTFAVDTSGSMNLGARLSLVRQALETLALALRPEDRVAVVAFGASPYLVLPHTAARERERILGAVRSLTPGGGTNVGAGLDLAYRVADEAFDAKSLNRIILCSDGVANVGSKGPEEILKRVEVFAKRGIYLSSVGFGMGKYNDTMLETIANKGNGNYAYVDSLQAATEIFHNNLPSTLQVLAQDAKIQVDFNPEVVSHYRLLGYENRDIADADFRNDRVDAGEVGPSSTVTVLYELQRKPSSSGDLGKVFIRYRDTGTGRVEEYNYPIPPGVLITSLKETSEQFRFIACVAETAELLRESYWARNGSFAAVLVTLDGLSPQYKARREARELTSLVTQAQALAFPQTTIREKR